LVDAVTELLGEVRIRLARAFVLAYGTDRGQEALAEALAWAWEHPERTLALDNPVAYLFAVGRSRTRPRRRVVLPAPADLGLPHIEPQLISALASLTERQRVCVALVVGGQWTHTETAELLGITKASVQVHIERGMAHLRAQLGVNTADA
jgi:DNA-directed RNA polymerase specialized sigma24 family protein